MGVSSARSASARATMAGPASGTAGRTASSAAPGASSDRALAEQAVDGEEDRAATAAGFLVGLDGPELDRCEPRQPRHDLRRGEPVVLPDGQIGGLGDVPGLGGL